MALKWIEGFESYSNLLSFLPFRYASFVGPSSSFQPGRAVGNALQFNGTNLTTPNLGNQATYFVGFAFRNVNLTPSNVQMPVLFIQDAGTTQVSLTFNPSTGLFSVFTGVTLIGTGTFAITTGFWYYIEIKVTVNAATGVVNTKVNTVADITFGPGNTQQSGNNYANTFQFRGPAAIGLGGSYQLDDIYILDSTGGANNTFLGDMKVEGLQVIDAGFHTAWGVNVPGTPNYQAVQVLNDGLYVLSNTPGQIDTYECNSLSFITSNIAGVSAIYWTRNTDSTTHVIASLIRQGGTDYPVNLPTINNTAWRAYQNIWEQDPSTSAPWTVTGVGTAEYGEKLIS